MSEPSSQIALLGAIADEAAARCTAERARIEKELDDLVAWERKRFPNGPWRWADERRLLEPVSCTVQFEPVDEKNPMMCAPIVRIEAEGAAFTSERAIRLSLCRNGLLRIVVTGWPADTPRPSVGAMPPKTFEDARTTARRFLDAALPPLFAIADPTRRAKIAEA